MRKYAGRVKVTHLKDRMKGSVDNLNGRQEKERNVVLGSGDVNIAEVMKAAIETGVEYHFIEDESSNAGVQLPLHLAYLRGLEADRQSVALSVEKLHKGMVEADSKTLHMISTEELTYGHSSGNIEDRAAFLNSLISGKSDFAEINFEDQDITIKGDVAWVRGVMKAKVLDGGNPNNISLKILYIWTKEDGIWKLLGRQAVK